MLFTPPPTLTFQNAHSLHLYTHSVAIDFIIIIIFIISYSCNNFSAMYKLYPSEMERERETRAYMYILYVLYLKVNLDFVKLGHIAVDEGCSAGGFCGWGGFLCYMLHNNECR